MWSLMFVQSQSIYIVLFVHSSRLFPRLPNDVTILRRRNAFNVESVNNVQCNYLDNNGSPVTALTNTMSLPRRCEVRCSFSLSILSTDEVTPLLWHHTPRIAYFSENISKRVKVLEAYCYAIGTHCGNDSGINNNNWQALPISIRGRYYLGTGCCWWVAKVGSCIASLAPD